METWTAEQVARALGVSPRTLKKMIRTRVFPDSFPVSEGTRRWLPKDVEAYLHLKSRISGRRVMPAEESEEISEKSSSTSAYPPEGNEGATEGKTEKRTRKGSD